MGKFKHVGINPFWKHENCLDVFFVIDKVRFDENGKNATLTGNWMVQGVEFFWPCTNTTRLNITKAQYDKWHRYQPRGEYYYV